MDEPEPDEVQRRLVPSRIEPNDARVALKFEGADGAARRHEPQDGNRPQAEAGELRFNRKA